MITDTMSLVVTWNRRPSGRAFRSMRSIRTRPRCSAAAANPKHLKPCPTEQSSELENLSHCDFIGALGHWFVHELGYRRQDVAAMVAQEVLAKLASADRKPEK